MKNRDYLNELLTSKNIVYKDDISNFKDSGLYILYPNFDLKQITNETYLKVGITNEKKGLHGRLRSHFNSSKVKVKNDISLDIKLMLTL